MDYAETALARSGEKIAADVNIAAPTSFDQAALDFALRGPPTDQILVAKFLRDRSLLGVSWES